LNGNESEGQGSWGVRSKGLPHLKNALFALSSLSEGYEIAQCSLFIVYVCSNSIKLNSLRVLFLLAPHPRQHRIYKATRTINAEPQSHKTTPGGKMIPNNRFPATLHR